MSEKISGQAESEKQLAQIMEKLQELLHCGNERVELAAAKELLALVESEVMQKKETETSMEVTIKVIE